MSGRQGRQTKACVAFAIEHTDKHERAARRVARFQDLLGHAKIFSKTAGEMSIGALVVTVNSFRNTRTKFSKRPSKTKVLWKDVGTVAAQEAHGRQYHRHPQLQVLIVGAANLITKCLVGEWTRSPYERTGDRGLEKMPTSVQFNAATGQRQAKSGGAEVCVWVFEPRTGEGLIGTTEGGVIAFAARRVKDDEKLDLKSR